jgi:2-keto-4-pentenoate hydratase
MLNQDLIESTARRFHDAEKNRQQIRQISLD